MPILIVTACIQGIPLISQALLSLYADPILLGQVRLYESALSVALIAVSCGMPSVAFREAATGRSTQSMFEWSISAFLVTILATLLSFTLLSILITWHKDVFSAFLQLSLPSLFIALLPASGIRIFIAAILGGNQSRKIIKFIFLSAIFYVVFIVIFVIYFDIMGWIIARVIFDSAILSYTVSIVYGWKNFNLHRIPAICNSLGQTFLSGIGANYAFLVRALADNLPLFYFSKNANNPNDLGLYAFASLVIIFPSTVYGAILQSKVSKMIALISDPDSFNKQISAEIKFAAYISILAITLLHFASKAISLGYIIPHYKDASQILFILSLSLPARAISMVAGSICVIRGWYSKSSLLGLTEIFIFVATSISLDSSLTNLGWAVTISVWISVIPACYLISRARL